MSPSSDELRVTVRVRGNSDPDLLAWLKDYHKEDETWTNTLLRALRSAMETESGDSQLDRIEYMLVRMSNSGEVVINRRPVQQAAESSIDGGGPQHQQSPPTIDLGDNPLGSFDGFT